MPLRFIDYFPEPLRGQATLETFRRTRALRYAGNDQILRHGLPLYETLAAETHGDPEAAKRNLLVHGDCRATCALLRDRGLRVDLVYIDPPFASGADYAKKVVLRPVPGAPAPAAEVDNPDAGFDEKMYGDVWEKEKYLNWMYDNLSAIKSVMADDASIYVHLDWHIGHYVKVMLDEIFGEDNFRNEIVWKKYGGVKNQASERYTTATDSIFWYSMGERIVFHQQYRPMTQKYIEDEYKYIDEDGRRYALLRGRSYQSSGGQAKKKYLDENPGTPITSLWDEPTLQLNTSTGERLAYATQKPEALLERIVRASSDEGMVVADFFGGSGTAAAVAARLGRRFVTCDVNRNAIQTMRDRLVAQGTAFTQEEIQDGVELYRNPAQTMDKLCALVPGLHRLTAEEIALGMKETFWFGAIDDPKAGRVPVWAPDLKEGSGRVLSEATLLHALYEFLPELDGTVKRAVFLYVDTEKPVAEMEAQVRKENIHSTVAVEFVDLKPYLDRAILQDEAEWELKEDREGLTPGWRLTLTAFRSDRLAKEVEALNAKAVFQPSAKGRKVITLSDKGLEAIEWVGVDTQTEGPWRSAAEVRIEPSGIAVRDGEKTKARWDATLFCEGPDRPKRLKIRSVLGDETVFQL